MPHLSQRKLEKDHFLQINKQLYKILEGLVRNNNTKVFLNEILTKTEKVMIAKRLATIAMLDKGESSYSIEKMLKISSSTVIKMSHKFGEGDYNALIKEMKRYKSLSFQLQKLFPPRVGRGRFNNYLKF
jgi:uncharacterized protein YerC